MTTDRQSQLPALELDDLRGVCGGAMSLGSVVGGEVGSLIDRAVNPTVIGSVLRRPPGSMPSER
jgi:hypothetical protein